MPIKHVTELAEAYLNNQLSTAARQQVELHLADCPNCTRYFFYLRRLDSGLNEVMQQALGEPKLPSALRYKVKQMAFNPPQPWWRRIFRWRVWGQTLNNVGVLTATVLLASGLFIVIQTMLPHAEPERESLTQSHLTSSPVILLSPTAVMVAVVPRQPTPRPTAAKNSLRETLPTLAKSDFSQTAYRAATSLPIVTQLKSKPTSQPTALPKRNEPHGKLAFAVFDPATSYQVYLLNLTDSEPEIFALKGVSEPTLRKDGADYRLAFRGWGDPARALLSSDLSGHLPDQISHFWEDAQPDWSPIENRIIFASQREVDRKWRLYTAWGDGSMEKNLRREGQSPTFAPDGQRFAFQSCEAVAKNCGLWQARLDNSEYEAELFLADPLATSPDWSPMGEQIVYMANPHDNWDLYLTDSNGHASRRLTDDAALDGAPTWSPDGQWVAFFSNRGGHWGVWLLQVDSNELRLGYDLADLAISSPENQAQWWHEQISWSE